RTICQIWYKVGKPPALQTSHRRDKCNKSWAKREGSRSKKARAKCPGFWLIVS
ncbi:hypothetical protein HMPREF1576_00661, partial [Gardnerella pickettii JCP7719]